jgi:hypothetical protein
MGGGGVRRSQKDLGTKRKTSEGEQNGRRGREEGREERGKRCS